MVTYPYTENGDLKREFFGEFCISDDKKEVAFTVFEDDGWYQDNGLMISASAKDREEGIRIANKVMKDILKTLLE